MTSAPPTHADYQLSQLDQLEAESIHIFREAAAEFEKPALMFSGGKDSIVMLRLAEKAFFPAKIPFPLVQIDTGLDFPEVLQTRDNWVNRLGVRLVVASIDEAIKSGVVVDDGKTSRNRHADRDPPELRRGERLHRDVRRWPPRRGEGPRQGARLLPPRRLRPVGPEEPAPRAVEPLQRQAARRRAHARLPAVQLDRARRLVLPPPGGCRAALDLLRPQPRACSTATACGCPRARSTPARRARRSSRRPCATAPSAT